MGFAPLRLKAVEEELAPVIDHEGIMVVGEGEPMNGSSTKRKAELVLTDDKGLLESCATKMKAEEPAAGCLLGDKITDLMPAACGEGKAAALAGVASGNGKGTPAAMSMDVGYDEEEEEDFLATLSPRVLEIAMADLNIPGLVLSNCRSDFYETEDESEEGESNDEDDYDEDEEEGKSKEVAEQGM